MSGPGRLTQALGIDLSYCGKALFDKRCHIEDAPDVPARMIGTSSRIGISKSTGLPWRKYVIGNPHVSKAFFTHPITASSHDRDPNLT
jgi:DNA-3-methyladenine glycosylase